MKAGPQGTTGEKTDTPCAHSASGRPVSLRRASDDTASGIVGRMPGMALAAQSIGGPLATLVREGGEAWRLAAVERTKRESLQAQCRTIIAGIDAHAHVVTRALDNDHDFRMTAIGGLQLLMAQAQANNDRDSLASLNETYREVLRRTSVDDIRAAVADLSRPAPPEQTWASGLPLPGAALLDAATAAESPQ